MKMGGYPKTAENRRAATKRCGKEGVVLPGVTEAMPVCRDDPYTQKCEFHVIMRTANCFLRTLVWVQQ